MFSVQDIIEKQEFSGSIDNNTNNNHNVCLRLPVLYCPGKGKGVELHCCVTMNPIQEVTSVTAPNTQIISGILRGICICHSKIVDKQTKTKSHRQETSKSDFCSTSRLVLTQSLPPWVR